jgi:hypothetical protein
MMKRDFTKDFDEIKKMTNKIRTLNESISFTDSYCDEDDGFAPQDAEFEQGADDCANGRCDLAKAKSDEVKAVETEGGANAVNHIREIALKGMVVLCSNPEDPTYQTLKKIFTFCDKAVMEKADEEMPK